MNADLYVNKLTKQYISMTTFSVLYRTSLIKAKTGIKIEFSFLETNPSKCAGFFGVSNPSATSQTFE